MVHTGDKPMPVYSGYVVQDRSSPLVKWSIQITDGSLNWNATSLPSGPEPVIRDRVSTSDYYKIFVSDGILGLELVVSTQNDDISLSDSSLGFDWKLVIDEGTLTWVEASVLYTDYWHVNFLTASSSSSSCWCATSEFESAWH